MSIWREDPEGVERLIVAEMISRKLAKETEDWDVVLKRWNGRKDMDDISAAAEHAYWQNIIMATEYREDLIRE